MKLVKGSLAAKRYMASIRAKKKRSIGAIGDYAKFEIAVIKKLATLLKQPYKKTQETVNTSETLLNIISVNFDKKVSVNETAKQLKAKLIEVNKKSPIQSFIELLSKLPKKETENKVKFPIKLPATVTIGNLKRKNKIGSIVKYTKDSSGNYYFKGYQLINQFDGSYQVLSPLGFDIVGEYVSLNEGKKTINEYMKGLKNIGNVKASKQIKKTLKDKNLYLPHGYKTVKRKRKIGEVHTDTKSHNVKINVLSGEISKGRQKMIENLSYLYGKLASDFLFATTIRAKKSIQKELSIVKKELNRLKDNTGFYK